MMSVTSLHNGGFFFFLFFFFFFFFWGGGWGEVVVSSLDLNENERRAVFQLKTRPNVIATTRMAAITT